MNITLTLLLALMPSAFPFEQLPAQVDQLKETPVFITDLRKAPTKVVLDGRSLTIAAYLWRDFMSGSVSGPDGSPMMAVFKVATTDKDLWSCPASPVCEVSARNGPKWGPGVFVDVVVRLIDKEGRPHMLQVPKQYVQRTD